MTRFRRILIGLVVAAAALFIAGTIYQRRDFQRVFPEADRRITRNADSFTLFSVSPDQAVKPSPSEATGNLSCFHEYSILGAVQVKDAVTRKSLMDDLYRQWGPGTFGAMCFSPRHGIRAVRDGRTVDYLICFHCGYVHVYHDKETKPVVGTVAHDTAQFNAVLLRNKIRLPQQ